LIWIELAIELPSPAADVMASAICELTGGVEIRDAGTLIRAGEGRVVLVTQCAPESEQALREEIEAVASRMRAAGEPVDPMLVRRREAHEDEWRDVWKQYFRAQRVGRTFLIRPSWDLVPAEGADRVIDIDPGRAFGTGGHASTRLVIAMAEELAGTEVQRFVDLGCGSGILSIAAARIWPSASGLALDVDPEAVATTLENFALNAITTVEARTGSLADVGAPADLMLANIEAAVLVPLAPEIPRFVSRGGTIILSGLLTSDFDAVVAAYSSAGLWLEERRDETEWTGLRFGRLPG
jgi:ribosomal protein L11 methyltransferase